MNTKKLRIAVLTKTYVEISIGRMSGKNTSGTSAAKKGGWG